MSESLGHRIAKHRADLGWTQAELAERVGIAAAVRAMSHIEAGISNRASVRSRCSPGVFKLEPHELVRGTDYPVAKAERLPVVAARYTEVEHQLAVVEARLEWSTTRLPGCALSLAEARELLGGLLARTYDRRGGPARGLVAREGSSRMIDDFAKEYLHDDLRYVREAMLWKLEGLGEYDARRPLMPTGPISSA